MADAGREGAGAQPSVYELIESLARSQKEDSARLLQAFESVKQDHVRHQEKTAKQSEQQEARLAKQIDDALLAMRQECRDHLATLKREHADHIDDFNQGHADHLADFNQIHNSMACDIGEFLRQTLENYFGEAQKKTLEDLDALRGSVVEFSNNFKALSDKVHGYAGKMEGWKKLISGVLGDLCDLAEKQMGEDSTGSDNDAATNGATRSGAALAAALPPTVPAAGARPSSGPLNNQHVQAQASRSTSDSVIPSALDSRSPNAANNASSTSGPSNETARPGGRQTVSEPVAANHQKKTHARSARGGVSPPAEQAAKDPLAASHRKKNARSARDDLSPPSEQAAKQPSAVRPTTPSGSPLPAASPPPPSDAATNKRTDAASKRSGAAAAAAVDQRTDGASKSSAASDAAGDAAAAPAAVNQRTDGASKSSAASDAAGDAAAAPAADASANNKRKDDSRSSGAAAPAADASANNKRKDDSRSSGAIAATAASYARQGTRRPAPILVKPGRHVQKQAAGQGRDEAGGTSKGSAAQRKRTRSDEEDSRDHDQAAGDGPAAGTRRKRARVSHEDVREQDDDPQDGNDVQSHDQAPRDDADGMQLDVHGDNGDPLPNLLHDAGNDDAADTSTSSRPRRTAASKKKYDVSQLLNSQPGDEDAANESGSDAYSPTASAREEEDDDDDVVEDDDDDGVAIFPDEDVPVLTEWAAKNRGVRLKTIAHTETRRFLAPDPKPPSERMADGSLFLAFAREVSKHGPKMDAYAVRHAAMKTIADDDNRSKWTFEGDFQDYLASIKTPDFLGDDNSVDAIALHHKIDIFVVEVSDEGVKYWLAEAGTANDGAGEKKSGGSNNRNNKPKGARGRKSAKLRLIKAVGVLCKVRGNKRLYNTLWQQDIESQRKRK